MAAVAVLTLAAAGTLTACTGSTTVAPSVAPSPGSTGGSVDVYPGPGSKTASPRTQISVRGVAPGKVGTILVTGSESGQHTGRLRADSDGDGASLHLSEPFVPGETVTVSTSLPVVGASDGKYSFTASTPVPQTVKKTSGPPATKGLQHYLSAPTVGPAALTVQAGSLNTAGGYFFLAPKGKTGPNRPMIVDSAGRLVWSGSIPDGESIYNFDEQTYQGQPVLTWWQGGVTPGGTGLGQDVIYDDSYQKIATVQAGNGYQVDLHEFTIASNDVALVTAYQPVEWNDAVVGGSAREGVVIDSIYQEIDIPTGNVLAEWHSLDHVPLSSSYAAAKGATPYDYFHINSLSLGQNGTMLVSSRGTHTVYDIDPATGAVIWRLGGKHSDFTGAGAVFNSQHDAKWVTPTSISLFDNGAGVGSASEAHSRGMLIALNTATHTARLAQGFQPDGVPKATSQGSAEPLPSGDVVVGWGAQPYVSEYSSSGRLLFQAKFAAGFTSYRAFRSAWSGHPLTLPSVVANARARTTTVDVSWNGATQVRSWRLLSGDVSSALTASSPVARKGFQTTITAAGAPRYLRVEALDGGGHVLSTSAIVSPSAP